MVRIISAKKNEPKWMLEYRLNAYKAWLEMEEPNWANVSYKKPNYQDIIYYSAPKQKPVLDSLDDLDPEMKKTFDKLGISLEEQKKLANVAVDIVMDSVSVATSFKETLSEKGIIFCSISDAIQEHPELVKKYLGSVVPTRDNFFSALNSAVFSDGSFCYIPKGVKCPMELSTYFRINEAGTGQFERTLLIADEGWMMYTYNHLKEYNGKLPVKGMHGYSPDNMNMHAIFYAYGPLIKNGLNIDTFELIHIYPMLCKLLNISPYKDIDGDLNPNNDEPTDPSIGRDYLNPNIAVDYNVNEYRVHTYSLNNIRLTINLTNLVFISQNGEETIRQEALLFGEYSAPSQPTTVKPEFPE